MNDEVVKEGLRFRGPSKTLTDAHFLFFSGITGDVGRIHYDAEYAKQTQFGQPLAHGLLLVSLTALGASDWKDKPQGFIFVEQGCRFLRPVLVGDTVRPEFVIEKFWSERHKKFCRIKTAIFNQREEAVLDGFQLYRIIPPVDDGAALA
jgi:3-hydroxybutyryl-CoA dehydratase